MPRALWRWACLWAVLGLPALHAAPDDVFISARVTPAEVTLGQQLEYQVFITARNSVTHQINPTEPDFKGFTVVERGEPKLSDNEDERVFEWHFTLRPRQSGLLLIQPFVLTYVDARDGRSYTARTDRVPVRVLPAQAAPDIRPAKPIAEVPDFLAPYRQALLFVAVGLALSILAAVVFWWLARPRRPAARPAPTPPPPVTPDVAALRRLDALAAENLPAQGRVDEYHIRLSQILREYLGERYLVNAVESTTSEIGVLLGDLGVPGDVVAHCRRVLYGCDLEKFAGHEPTPEEMADLLSQGRRLVQMTPPLARRETRR